MSRKTMKGDEGISILEVMIVLVILSLIAVVGTTQVTQMMDRAKVDVAKLQLRQIESSLEIFRIDMQRYPTADEGLQGLIAAPEGTGDWRGPYLKNASLLLDPWGASIRYSLPSDDSFEIVSTGADKKEGGDGVASDLTIGTAG